jgi:hypothetical protein
VEREVTVEVLLKINGCGRHFEKIFAPRGVPHQSIWRLGCTSIFKDATKDEFVVYLYSFVPICLDFVPCVIEGNRSPMRNLLARRIKKTIKSAEQYRTMEEQFPSCADAEKLVKSAANDHGGRQRSYG